MSTDSTENVGETMETTGEQSQPETKDKSPGGVQQRKDFTSETNKIEINNLGRFQYGVCSVS